MTGDVGARRRRFRLRGNRLYVVQNRLNVVAEIKLDRTATRGEVVSRTGSPDFDVPATIAEFGGRFDLPHARFTTPPTPRRRPTTSFPSGSRR